jgi:hypothetical protein
MLTRRDVATLAWYSIVFSAVIAWAAFRHGGRQPGAHDGAHSDQSADPLDQNDGQRQLRRAVSRMVTQ